MNTTFLFSKARWALAPNFCPWVTRKSYSFDTNHMLGTLDFTGLEHWAPFSFLQKPRRDNPKIFCKSKKIF